MKQYKIPAFDLVIVDLYPFEETVKNMNGSNFIQDFAPLEPLKGLSFTREQVTPTSPRDLLMGLLNG